MFDVKFVFCLFQSVGRLSQDAIQSFTHVIVDEVPVDHQTIFEMNISKYVTSLSFFFCLSSLNNGCGIISAVLQHRF